MFNTDAAEFGGSGEFRNEKAIKAEHIPSHGKEQSVAVTIPPFGAVFFKGEGTLKAKKVVSKKTKEEAHQ